MFKKHAPAIALISINLVATAPVLASETLCLIAGWENPASVCESHHRTLASTCFNCHGPNGRSNTAIPSLAGLDKAYFLAAMQDFRSGKRESTVMQKYAKGYTDDEYVALAALFSTTPVNLAQSEKSHTQGTNQAQQGAKK